MADTGHDNAATRSNSTWLNMIKHFSAWHILENHTFSASEPGSKLVVLGMVIPPLIGNPYNGYINPYHWVDDHPLAHLMKKKKHTMALVATPNWGSLCTLNRETPWLAKKPKKKTKNFAMPQHATTNITKTTPLDYIFLSKPDFFLDRFYNAPPKSNILPLKTCQPPKKNKRRINSSNHHFSRRLCLMGGVFHESPISSKDLFVSMTYLTSEITNSSTLFITLFSQQASHSIASRMPHPKWRGCDPPLPPHVQPGGPGRGKDPPHFFAHRKLEHRGTKIAPWDP